MKRCPECRRDYHDDSLLYCLEDGVALVQGSVPAVGSGESPTVLFDPASGVNKDVRGNLPVERTRFIGRTEELANCVELLADDTRLLTITGFGGCGKTRLALKTAETVADRFAFDAWFVDLAPVTDENMVLPAIARVLPLRQDGNASLIYTLVQHIGSSRLLLVLDNCEHILTAAARVVDEILTRCPGVRLLITSREPLNLQGEKVFALQPLALPDLRMPDGARTDAVDFFVDRAVSAQIGFKLTDDNFQTVVDIVSKLEGIPLAIELAAARLRVLSVKQINEKLDQRFRLLADAANSRISRHQTLRAAIQWSYDPLSEDEKGLLRVMSVFAGSCDLEQVSGVYGGFDEFTTLDLLSRLVDKSLVIVEQGPGSQKRYRLLETVRQFALEILSERGEEQAARRAHLDTMLAVAERAYEGRIANDEEWANVLEMETSNLQQALEFARRSNADDYLKLAGALGWFWTARSHISEGREHLSAALKATPREPPRIERARALWVLAHIEGWCGDLDAAQKWTDEALDSCHQLGDSSEVALVFEGIGWSQFSAEKDEDALASFGESLRIHIAEGDPVLINRANVGVAQALVALGRIGEARPMALAIIEFSHSRADKRNEHFGWHYLADCALIEGDCEESLRLYQRSLALAAEIGDKIETTFEIQGVAMSLAGLGRVVEAEILDAAVRAEMERIGADPHFRFWDELMEKYLGAARRESAPEIIAEARREGRLMSFDDAVSTALKAEDGQRSQTVDTGSQVG